MPKPDPDDTPTQIERDLQRIKDERRDDKMKFWVIAKCLVELAIENRALWKSVQSTRAPYQWLAELAKARQEYAELERDVEAIFTTEMKAFPTLLDKLTERLKTAE
jgi:hypothetical protein